MLTKRQRRVMLFIESYMARSGGVSPSFYEIACGCGMLSKSHVWSVLLALEGRGHIRRLPRRNRAIEVLRPVSRFAYYTFDDVDKRLVLARSTLTTGLAESSDSH